MLKAEFTLNTLLTAMRNVGCGDPHPIFAGGLRYIPPSARNATNRAAFEELSHYGFTQGNGFTPEFEDVLHLIDRPKQEFFAYARDTEEQIGILVAAQNRSAVSVLCRGETVELAGVSPDTHPADALVKLLPPYEPAPIRPFSLPQDDFKPQVGSDIFDDAPARSREAQELDALFQQPHFGVGQLYSGNTSVNYLDLNAGRVGIALAGGYISVLPGEPKQLSHKLKAATP
ncbi:ESX secretion-associated protein EspG [Amycolatopsis mongoliensis]|uniref:ESX secretion-associated protein EspG n=1 Tax=Amycolatopsis mongoliensis TaxID=715475 RepID=A0A9Y2JUG8_9PSEU|nr:ESX secretion-associated protein EspG [Amycolatopsis sp. 4-36]WIY03891.1 ESX secretion-associated protein EspG [Amycolatopsis sp. 4-36]